MAFITHSLVKRSWSVFLLLLLLFVAPLCHAQVAGLNSYAALRLTPSPYAAALGMDYISKYDASIEGALCNPALINAQFHAGQMALSYMGLSQGTNFATVAYGWQHQRLGTFVFGLRYCSYGRFDGYDEYDVGTGTFSAYDMVLSVGWGRAVTDNFSIGATLKPVFSHYESYSSWAVAADVALSYASTDRRFSATVMGRNIGAQITTFDGTTERMPFELTAGLSYKLAKAPFRFFFNCAELQRWDLSYEDMLNPSTTTDPFTGEVLEQSGVTKFFDKLGRHLQLGVELNIGQSFFARVGYNYRQAIEMKAADVLNMSGFSFGVGVKLKRFELSYSHNNYHLWQAPNYLSVIFKI